MVEDAWRTGDLNALMIFRETIQAATGATGGRSSPRSNINASRLAALTAEIEQLVEKAVRKLEHLPAHDILACRWCMLRVSW
jgi:hypothetical protein